MSGQLLNDEQRRDWLRLIKSENVGPVTFLKLINRFGSAREALAALPELSGRGGLKRSIRICPVEDAEKDMTAAAAMGARFIAFGEPDYPVLLRHTDGAPPLICAKGRFELFNQTSVAIVGSRNASAVGMNFARRLASDLGAAGYVTVSGLARGIDTNVHVASLETGTIAVVAGGIDIIYPPENGPLQDEIFEKGVVVSEMMPGLRPQARHFPRRNRLISGISRGTVVVEAARRSGSLITARLASEQNREVFAVPGSPLDPRAGGTNKLIKDGAVLITGAPDVIAVMRDVENRQIKQGDFFAAADDDHLLMDEEPDLNTRQQIISLLSPCPSEINDLARLSGAGIAMVHSVLLELELAGRLERHTGQRVSLV
jgi:DNA processing protein